MKGISAEILKTCKGCDTVILYHPLI